MAGPKDRQQARVLIVDPDAAVALVLGEMLSETGHDIRLARDEGHAGRILDDQSVDVVLASVGLVDAVLAHAPVGTPCIALTREPGGQLPPGAQARLVTPPANAAQPRELVQRALASASATDATKDSGGGFALPDAPSAASGRALRPGDTVDDFMVERFLDAGAMGEVYVARDSMLDRRVALKMLRTPFAEGGAHRVRFEREARALSRVVHPNVVGIHAFGQHGKSNWYIAMEYVDGESLADALTRGDRFDVEQVASIIRQMASGLSEAHALSIIHRDVKPGNILLRRLASGSLLAKVADFGLARGVDDGPALGVTRSRAVVGTPAYMSPEQAQAAPLDARSDQYSLAAVAFEMLAGRQPFVGNSVVDVLYAHVNAPAPALADIKPTVPWSQDLEQVLSKALAKAPEARYPDINAFAEALSAAAGIDARADATTTCPSCSAHVSASARFCPDCGGPIPVPVCPACGTAHGGERFQCIQCGTSLLRQGRRRSSDGKGARSSSLTAAVLVCRWTETDGDDYAELAETFAALVEREGGRALAVVGAEATAVFGVGGIIANAASTALDAALSLRTRLDIRVKVAVEVGRLRTFGLGTCWGTAFAGGEAIQEARQLAAALRPGQVGAGLRAYREVRGWYDTDASGVGDAREVHRRKDLLFPFEVEALRQVPLIGSEEALQALDAAAEVVEDERRQQVVSLVGGAGLGKSRILAEFTKHLEDAPELWRVDVVRCKPADYAHGHDPFAEMLRARLRLVDPDAARDITERLVALPGVEGSELPMAEVGARVKALTRFLGVRSATDVPAHPASGAERELVYDLVASYVRECTTRCPVVLVVEDLQWAKPPTLIMLQHIIAACRDFPVLVVATVRNERATQVNAVLARDDSTDVARVELQPLDETHTRQLVAAILSGNLDVPRALGDAIFAFTGGNPRHIEDAVDALVEEGVFTHTADGEWVVGDSAAVGTLESSLSDLVRRRLERLPPAERRVLTAVAVAGQHAPLALLEHMLGRPIPPRDREVLKASGLLLEHRRRRHARDKEYGFRQPHLRGIVQTAAGPKELAELHGLAADWCESWTGIRPPGFQASIAQHCLAAGLERRAVPHLLAAARDATRAYANADAHEAYTTVMLLARQWYRQDTNDSEAVDALLAAAAGRAALELEDGKLQEAIETATVVIDMATANGADEETVRGLCLRGEAHEASGLYAEALSDFESAVAASESIGGMEVYVLGRSAMTFYTMGRHDEAERMAERALDVSSDLTPNDDLYRGLGSVHGVLGHLASKADDHEGARHHYTTARDYKSRSNDAVGAAMANLALGNVAFRARDFARARIDFEMVIAQCRALGNARGMAIAATNLGDVLLKLRLGEEALDQLKRAESQMRDMGLTAFLSETLRLRALAHLEVGELQEAEQAAKQAIAVAEELGNAGAAAAARTALTEVSSR